MTQQDLGKLQADTIVEYEKLLNITESLFANTKDISEFKNTVFLNKAYSSTNLDDGVSLAELLETLKEIQETALSNPRLGLSIMFELIGVDYEGDSPSANIDMSWYVFDKETSIAKIPSLVKSKVKQEMKQRLFARAKELNTKVNYSQEADCKLLGLFSDGKIDFDTLVSIIYTDCSI
jgi:hypothetical protein